MFTSFGTALSALNAHTTAIDAVGNNLANLNTSGFKSSVAAFHDLVTQSMGAGLGETQAGFGVGRPTILRQFSQGVIQSSTGPLDVAIQARGFLSCKNDAGATLYTRGGHLLVDKEGAYRPRPAKKYRVGWRSGRNGYDGPVVDIVVPVGTLKAPTTSTRLFVGSEPGRRDAVLRTPSGAHPQAPMDEPPASDYADVLQFDRSIRPLGRIAHRPGRFLQSRTHNQCRTPTNPSTQTWTYAITADRGGDPC